MDTGLIDTSTLSKDFETEGFDLQSGKSWIYPTNYPTREYQYNIIQKALLKNTLVSLPTGLGKTFIAAVVMYNYYRWYPHGKIIFMAPTKPLVKQQVDACYNIMAIPPESTAELTGAKASTSRASLWVEKRVFFVTPQVLQNDLNKIAELGGSIKCLVFDEAHKARGNHAYCEVIRRLIEQNHKYFRVLALSATPGSNVNDVSEVIQNLLISHLEFRTEESLDVKPYVFKRSIETVVVPLGDKLEEVRDEYLKNLEYYVKTLRTFNVIQGNCGALTKGKVFILMRDFQNKHRGTKSSNYSEIMRCLNICVTLYHAYELLIRHGLRSFLSFFDEHIEKPLLKGNHHIRSILNNVRNYLGPIPNVEVLPDGTFPEVPKNIVFGHPKYYKLRDVLVAHFRESEENTRVIVFFEYRESVMEAHTMLLQSRPVIQPKIFLGQGSGITQKIQIGVVKAFREGRCNTLLSTCIGEEGLDVGEVDLIVCFDVSSKSPIRMVQRMGRTGRKREGKVLVLVTEGREQQTLKDCLIHKSNISTFVLGSKQLVNEMYNQSPRLVPEQLSPKCEKIFITVKKIEKNRSVKDMLRSLSSNSSDLQFSQNLELKEVPDKVPTTTMLFNQVNPLNVDLPTMFSNHIEKQRNLQRGCIIGHSKSAKVLTDLLMFADSKRFNLPTQISSTQDKQRNLKQGDIRNMFLQTNTQQDFITQPTSTTHQDNPNTLFTNLTEKRQESDSTYSSISKEVFSMLSSYCLLEFDDFSRKCRHCPPQFYCEDFKIQRNIKGEEENNNWTPSDDILDTILLSDLKSFHNALVGKTQDNIPEHTFDDMCSQMLDGVNLTLIEDEANKTSIKEDDVKDKNESVQFEAPKSYLSVLDKFGNSIFLSTQIQERIQFPEISERDLLKMFKLNSIQDIFENLPVNSLSETIVYSPVKHIDDNSDNSLQGSPILSSGRVKHNILRKKKLRKEINTTIESGKEKANASQTQSHNTSISIEELCDLSYFGISSQEAKKSLNEQELLEIDTFCNLSQFGLKSPEIDKLVRSHETPTHSSYNNKPGQKEPSLSPINFTQFGLKSPEIDKLVAKHETPTNSSSCNTKNGQKETPGSPITAKLNESHDNLVFCDDDFQFPTQKNIRVPSRNIQHKKFDKKLCRSKSEEDFDINLPTQSFHKSDDNLIISNDHTEKNVVVHSGNTKRKTFDKKLCHSKGDDDFDFSAQINDNNEQTDQINLSPVLIRKSKSPKRKKQIQKRELNLTLNDSLNQITSSKNKNVESIMPNKVNNESQLSVTQILELLNETSKENSFQDLNTSIKNVSQLESSILDNLANYEELNTSFVPSSITESSTKKHFQNKSRSSTQFNASSKQNRLETESHSSDEFEEFSFVKPQLPVKATALNTVKKYKKTKRSHTQKKKRLNDFLDVEAELSEDEDVFVSDDEAEEHDNCYDKSFVNDETQNFSTQLQAHYLQSVRSPRRPGRFKIPQNRPNIANVYSQPIPDESDTYLEDSFCVDSDEEELTQRYEMSELDILEMKLKEQRKRKKSEQESKQKPKRRRVVLLSSDSE